MLTMSETILSGTIHVLTDKENQIYTPIYPKSRKDLIEGLENVNNTSDSSKRVAYATNASNDENGNNINNTYVKKDIIEIKYRKSSTTYNIGDIIYLHTLKLEKKLVCIKAGITSNGNLVISNTEEGALVNDGSVVWIIDSLADGIYNAPHQNSIYRGADITAYWDSGYMSTNIRAGKFVGMHIGDYIVKTINLPTINYTDKSGNPQTQDAQTFDNVQWFLACFNYFNENPAIPGTEEDSVIMINQYGLMQGNIRMNPTSTTEGGYVGSDMWNIQMPNWATAIKNSFGANHILTHHETLSNAVNDTGINLFYENTGRAIGLIDCPVEVNIPNLNMICGFPTLSVYDIGSNIRMLPLFEMQDHILGGTWVWLRNIGGIGTTHFAAYHSHAGVASHKAYILTENTSILVYFMLY